MKFEVRKREGGLWDFLGIAIAAPLTMVASASIPTLCIMVLGIFLAGDEAPLWVAIAVVLFSISPVMVCWPYKGLRKDIRSGEIQYSWAGALLLSFTLPLLELILSCIPGLLAGLFGKEYPLSLEIWLWGTYIAMLFCIVNPLVLRLYTDRVLWEHDMLKPYTWGNTILVSLGLMASIAFLLGLMYHVVFDAVWDMEFSYRPDKRIFLIISGYLLFACAFVPPCLKCTLDWCRKGESEK